MIRYKCVKCGGLLESPSSMAGQQDQCPLCGKTYTVPQKKTRTPLALGVMAAVGVIVVLAAILLWAVGQEPKRSEDTRAVFRKAVVSHVDLPMSIV